MAHKEELSSLLSSSESEGLDLKAAPTSSSLPTDPVAQSPGVLSYVSLLACTVTLSVDYSVVMPSLWLFLRGMDPDVPEALLGVTLAAFQLSSVCLGPAFGYWLDRRPMKEVVVFQLWTSIAGNLLYAFSTRVWVVAVSRFICGAGSTVGLSAAVYVIRTTTEADRSSAFAKLSGATLCGLLVGPAFNYPLTQLPHFRLLSVEINSLNSVGLLMMCVLMLALASVHLFFREPRVEPFSDKERERDAGLSLCDKISSIASVATVSLAVCSFVSCLNQISFETALPPITLQLWNFGQLQNSIVYTVLTGYLLLWYVVNGVFLARRLQDRVLLLLAWLCVGVGALFLIVTGAIQGTWRFWQFCVGSALTATSIPFFDAASGSLFSKMLPDASLQGRAQSALSLCKGVGILLGPLIAAPVLAVAPIWVFVYVGCAFLITFPFFLFSFRVLLPKSAQLVEVAEEEEAIN